MRHRQASRRAVTAAAALSLVGMLCGAAVAAADPVATVPLYRLYDSKNGINFYTTNKARRTQAISVGWTPIGIAGHCLPEKVPGTVPLMAVRLEQLGAPFGSSGRHVIFAYSTDIDEIVNLQNHGWSPESTSLSSKAEPVCWVAPARFVVGSHLGETVPFHRLYHPPGGASGDDHFYTISEDEMGSAVRDARYRYERVEAQLWASPTTVGGELPNRPPPIKVPGGGAADAPAGCTRFLGRADEFLCRTDDGQARCETLRQAGRVRTCRRARN
jgi:hypothetical protein